MRTRMGTRAVNGLALTAVCLLIAVLLSMSPTPLDGAVEVRSVDDHGWVKSDQIVVAAEGADGAAVGSGSTDRALYGHIYALHLDYADGVTSTTDITLTQASPSLTVLTQTNTSTDAWFYPGVMQTDSAGISLILSDRLLVSDRIDISVGETTSSTTALTATIYWGE